MSKFFKAIDQAERSRVVREEARRWGPDATDVRSQPGSEREDAPANGAQTGGEARSRLAGAHRLGNGLDPDQRRAARETPAAPTEPVGRVDDHLVTLVAPTSFETEQYRSLRHVLEEIRRANGLTLIGVSSPAASDGKSTTAINVAGALAQAPEARVLVVDADLSQSSVRRALGMGDGDHRGLVEAILDRRLSLTDVTRRLPAFNLSVVSAGHCPTARYEVLTSPRLGELLEEARRSYDYVLIDTPPLVPLPDCRVIAKWIDGFLVVVAAHKTPRKLLEEALNLIEPVKMVGLVFNGDDRLPSTYSKYTSAARRSARSHWSTR
jgi:capsular exopolysaccharide synthesis family protein